MQDKATICWKCSRACGGCSWSAAFIPVEGWTAKPTKINHDFADGRHQVIDSFRVDQCPQFENDETRYRTNNKIAPPIVRGFHNPTNKSQLRRAFEALPREELERRINTLECNRDVARWAFIEKKTSPEICFITGKSRETIRKIIARLLHRLTEVTA